MTVVFLFFNPGVTCAQVTTRGGKETIDPLMLAAIDCGMRKKDNVIDDSIELGDATMKGENLSQKSVPLPRPPQPFPQRLVKKMEDRKYR